MNWIDFIILLVLLTFMGLGFMQGLIRRSVGLLALYFGLVVATQYYRLLSNWLATLLRSRSTAVTESLVFVSILSLVAVAINWSFYLSYRDTRLGFLEIADRLGGMGLGLISGYVGISVALVTLRFMTQHPWPAWNYIRLGVIRGFGNSMLVPLFLNTLPTIYRTLTPWLPGGLPTIFQPPQ